MTNNYNEIKVKNNMQVDNNEEALEVVEKPQMGKVVSVQPKKAKRSLLGRLVTGIMGPEGLPSIGAYVNDEIIKPAIKNIIYDAITSGVGRALNMDYRQPRSRHGSHPGQRQQNGPSINYSNRYGNPQRVEPEERVARPARYGVEEYVIPDRFDAAHVLTSLQEYADRYDKVSVADYYDLIGVESMYVDNSYGWTSFDVKKLSIQKYVNGYIINLPPVEVI